ncbi:error-prone DNA polymerase [Ideonella paludis]|uniref:Error-prone DNA polymerase n=1 Tax=Ideonella paludis TaxID=1233411 RepID=A0ABS5DVF2_9BURK|nr:error-prone DNA polymerase [Ideonella paludis]MBQ0935074.1 error-prone DNA polymerase [Ideonella paludis]
MPAPYAELHCRSNFSFLAGASHPQELVARAQGLGYAALALTDEGSLGGVVRAHEEAKQRGLHLVVGARMSLLAAAAPKGGTAGEEGDAAPWARLVVLVQERRGYGNLAQWITVARRRAPKGQYFAYGSDLEGKVPHLPHLAGLPGCLALLVVEVGPGTGTARPQLPSFEAVFARALWLKTWLGDRAALTVASTLGPWDEELLDLTQKVSQASGLPWLPSGDVLMHSRARKPLQDVLTATRLNTTVAAAGWALQANAEQHLRSRQRLAELWPPDALARTVAWAGRCAFSLDELRYEYPQELVPEGHTPTTWLRALTEDGVRRRFSQGEPPKVRAQIEHELGLIAQLRYEPYFLTVADIVHWARAQGILCQGRGSAANSVVCFCLGVTEVDPARMSLLFERFISAERNEPPDIDVDFEHQRREEVIQYIYRKYGRHRAALTGVVITYRTRSALRDVGRALGFDLDRIDAVSRQQHGMVSGVFSAQRLAEHGFDADAPLVHLWVELTQQLKGFPRHLSQHPGGFVIAKDDIARLVPVENAAMAGRTVIEWDKDDLDALGLIKVDILALGMLSAIRRGLDLLVLKEPLRWGPLCQRSAPDRPDTPQVPHALPMSALPADDPAVYDMLCRGESTGVFQVESRAQMSMLPRLQPRKFYDLVIEVAIVRPGPIQGGMVHPYLKRRSGEEPVSYPSDEVKQALDRTLGVPIFQEQVMQLAILAADFTPGEADALRRGMAAWKRKGGLEPFHEKLVGRMVAKGYEREYAEAIFRQIQGFGEYGFPESHAASFALLVYVSAWLKHHHPDIFLAALLNSQPMGFYAPAQLVRDARANGVEVRPVDVGQSDWETTLEPRPEQPAAHAAHARHTVRPEPVEGASTASRSVRPELVEGSIARSSPALRAVRLGLHQVSGLPEAAVQRLVAARRGQGPFKDVADLAHRAELDARSLQMLAEANALHTLAGHRRQAAWAVTGLDTRPPPLLAEAQARSSASVSSAEEPAATLQPLSQGEALLADYRRTGLSLDSHPLALLRPQLQAFRVLPADTLRDCRPGQLVRASGLVTHRQRPATAKGVVFATLEDDTGTVNVIVWPQVAEAHRRTLLTARLLTVYGIWQTDGVVTHLIARRLVDHSHLLQGLQQRSRDFR